MGCEVMYMETFNASNVRQEFSHFIDTVVRDKPLTIKRNRDYIISFSMEHVRLLLAYYRFHVRYVKEDDGSITGSLNEIDVVVNGNNESDVNHLLAKELIEYAQEYNDEFSYYYNSLNRKSHFPYILHVLIQDNIDGVIRLLDA